MLTQVVLYLAGKKTDEAKKRVTLYVLTQIWGSKKAMAALMVINGLENVTE